MFPALKAGEWEPTKIREKKHKRSGQQTTDGDNAAAEPEDNPTYEEDPHSDEDAVYPLHQGRVVNWSCFYALLTYIYNTLSPPFHTPILLVAQPAWTLQDHEMITQFFFEKFRTPAFALVDHAVATIYAYNTPTATVIDIGYDKCDVTAVHDFAVNDIGRGIAVPEVGGRHMTERLQRLLENKGFTYDMSEQLKRSNICEVLAPNTPLPTEKEEKVNPASAASTGVNGVDPPPKNAGAPNGLPRGPGQGTEVGGEDGPDDDEGVLDVASIVTSGKTTEYLARKEREKAERAAAKKSAGEAAARPGRLPNAQRARNTFYYVEQKPEEELDDAMEIDEPAPAPVTVPAHPPTVESAPAPDPAAASHPVAAPESTVPAPTDASVASAPSDELAPATGPPSEIPAADAVAPALEAQGPITDAAAPSDHAAAGSAASNIDGTIADAPDAPAAPAVVVEPPPPEPPLSAKKEKPKVPEASSTTRREVEVGPERFRAMDDGSLDIIADTVHRCILSVPEISKRSELWDALVILGNGSKVRGKPRASSPCSDPQILTRDDRPQRRPPRHPQRQVPHLSLQRHDIHLGATLQHQHARRHGRQHPPTPIRADPRAPLVRREPAAARGHDGLEPRPSAAAVRQRHDARPAERRGAAAAL